jgi:hypothetical protein
MSSVHILGTSPLLRLRVVTWTVAAIAFAAVAGLAAFLS